MTGVFGKLYVPHDQLDSHATVFSDPPTGND